MVFRVAYHTFGNPLSEKYIFRTEKKPIPFCKLKFFFMHLKLFHHRSKSVERKVSEMMTKWSFCSWHQFSYPSKQFCKLKHVSIGMNKKLFKTDSSSSNINVNEIWFWSSHKFLINYKLFLTKYFYFKYFAIYQER